MWIRDHCNTDKMQNIAQRLGVDDPKVQSDLKIGIYIAGILIALIYLTQSIRNRGKSWLKLRPRAPDPGKSNTQKSAEKQTKAVRPFGSKSENTV